MEVITRRSEDDNRIRRTRKAVADLMPKAEASSPISFGGLQNGDFGHGIQ